jgi:sugar lactone lactonase YvrE
MTRSRLATRSAALALPAVLAAALMMTAAAPPGAAAGASGTPGQHTTLVSRFGSRDASFAESLAVDSHGRMYVSKTVWGQTTNRGSVVRVRTNGDAARFGPRFDLGATGMLVGIAVNSRDRVFVARYDFGGTAPSKIVRISANGSRTVATLPPGAWPNGLAFHRGALYVGDSALGHVWRFRPSAQVQELSRPWLHSRLLEPAPGQDIGVNGLAFWRDHLFLVNYTRNTLVRVGLDRDGRPLAPTVVTRGARLHTADGIAFDRHGRLWVTVNGTGEIGKPLQGQALLRMDRRGRVQLAVTDAGWMNYPTMIAVGRTPTTAHRVYVTDGAFNGGSPDLRTFTVH